MAADFDIDAVRAATRGEMLGSDIRFFESVDSTNRVASDLSDAEWTDGTVIMADYQSAGRGRSGRSWTAPPGSSIMISVLLRKLPAVLPVDYVMMSALSVRDTVQSAGPSTASLKWPNDVLLNGRKVSGILGEFGGNPGAAKVVLGIGINVNFPSRSEVNVPNGATSINWESGSTIRREDVAISLIRWLNVWYRDLTHRPETVFDSWAAALQTIGRSVMVEAGTEAWKGTALGVRRDGGLLVKTETGRVQTVYAGDVSLRH